MPTIIRKATHDDMLPAFKLVVEFHRNHFSAHEFDPEKAIGTLFQWARSERHALMVADRDGEVAGAMAMKLAQPWFSQQDIAVEDFLYVAQAHRGGWAAFRLVKAFITWGKECGAKHFRAGISSDYGPTAGRIYEHFGLKHVGGNYTMHL